MEILLPKKNIALDATLFTTIQSCARLADFRFNNNLVSIDGKSNALECGSLVHAILEKFNKEIKGNTPRSKAILLAMEDGMLYIRGCPTCIQFPDEPASKKDCHHPKGEYQGMQNTPEESEAKPKRIGWSWVLETMTQYFDHYKNDSWVPIEVEHVKGSIIYEDDEIRILWKAKYDLIVDTLQGIFPNDHKTMSQDRDTSDMNNQFMGQAVLLKVRNVIINKIGFQTSLKPAEKFKRVLMSYSLDRLTEWSQEIVPFWAKLMLAYHESGIWPPNFTHCENKFGHCQFIDVCNNDRGMREETIRMKFMKGKPWDISNFED